MPTPFWRSPEAVARLNRLDRSALALEFLRRNPQYRADRERTLRQMQQHAADAEALQAAFARKWGLCFCPGDRSTG